MDPLDGHILSASVLNSRLGQKQDAEKRKADHHHATTQSSVSNTNQLPAHTARHKRSSIHADNPLQSAIVEGPTNAPSDKQPVQIIDARSLARQARQTSQISPAGTGRQSSIEPPQLPTPNGHTGAQQQQASDQNEPKAGKQANLLRQLPDTNTRSRSGRAKDQGHIFVHDKYAAKYTVHQVYLNLWRQTMAATLTAMTFWSLYICLMFLIDWAQPESWILSAELYRVISPRDFGTVSTMSTGLFGWFIVVNLFISATIATYEIYQSRSFYCIIICGGLILSLEIIVISVGCVFKKSPVTQEYETTRLHLVIAIVITVLFLISYLAIVQALTFIIKHMSKPNVFPDENSIISSRSVSSSRRRRLGAAMTRDRSISR